jgi:hypothetical protein
LLIIASNPFGTAADFHQPGTGWLELTLTSGRYRRIGAESQVGYVGSASGVATWISRFGSPEYRQGVTSHPTMGVDHMIE